MKITDIIEINIGTNKRKIAYRIYTDYEYAFLLYKQDIKEYQLEIDTEISLELYKQIIEDTVYRRAKQKALAILKHMDRTEREMYTKLKKAYYTDTIIERTIEYLKGYNYIDDERYASNYIRIKKSTLSKLALSTKLMLKGINKELLEKIISIEYDAESYDIDPEILAINKLIRKKYKNNADLSYEEKQKLIASLYRKGFSLDKINKCLG